MGRRIARYAHMFDIFNPNTGSFQAITHRLGRKARAMLHTIKPLLLSRGDYSRVFNNRRRGIAVIGVYSENVHELVQILFHSFATLATDSCRVFPGAMVSAG